MDPLSEVLALLKPQSLASQETIAIEDIAGDTFIGMSKTAPMLQLIIDAYFKRSGLDVRAKHEIDNLGMAMSLVRPSGA
jgi:LysR family hca operon transcriptional activator